MVLIVGVSWRHADGGALGYALRRHLVCRAREPARAGAAAARANTHPRRARHACAARQR